MAAPPNSQWVEYYDGLLMQLFTGIQPALAIVFGSSSAAGALLDTTNMITAFGRTGLGFAVLNAGIDLSLDKLRALIHAAASFSPIEGTADKVEAIALYFAGHGGSDSNNKPYIELAYSETVTVDEILSPFTCNKYKNAKKLFFFDVCCQADSCKSVDLPARANSLVAIATDSRSSGDYKDGGFWTRHLCKYITEDMDIFSMLTLTRQKTIESAADVVGRYHAGEIQEPCFAACMDHFNLKSLRKTSRSIEVDGNTAGAGRRSRPVQFGDPNIDSNEDVHPTLSSKFSSVPNSELDTNDLRQILEVLSMLGPFSKWENLGLNFGLLQGTLDVISEDRGGRVEKCTREMLVAWLQWKDNVLLPEYGKPSWRRLLDALEPINSKLATEIERSKPWISKRK